MDKALDIARVRGISQGIMRWIAFTVLSSVLRLLPVC